MRCTLASVARRRAARRKSPTTAVFGSQRRRAADAASGRTRCCRCPLADGVRTGADDDGDGTSRTIRATPCFLTHFQHAAIDAFPECPSRPGGCAPRPSDHRLCSSDSCSLVHRSGWAFRDEVKAATHPCRSPAGNRAWARPARDTVQAGSVKRPMWVIRHEGRCSSTQTSWLRSDRPDPDRTSRRKTSWSPGGPFRAQNVEATTGFEPVNRGFADLRVEPLHHVADVGSGRGP